MNQGRMLFIRLFSSENLQGFRIKAYKPSGSLLMESAEQNMELLNDLRVPCRFQRALLRLFYCVCSCPGLHG